MYRSLCYLSLIIEASDPGHDHRDEASQWIVSSLQAFVRWFIVHSLSLSFSFSISNSFRLTYPSDPIYQTIHSSIYSYVHSFIHPSMYSKSLALVYLSSLIIHLSFVHPLSLNQNLADSSGLVLKQSIRLTTYEVGSHIINSN